MSNDWKWWLKQWPFALVAFAASSALAYASYRVYAAVSKAGEFHIARRSPAAR